MPSPGSPVLFLFAGHEFRFSLTLFKLFLLTNTLQFMRTARKLSLFLLYVTCLTALYIGYEMISDPMGNSLGLPFYLLNGSVFNDYIVPGWVLLITVGGLSAFVIWSIHMRTAFYSFMIMVQGTIILVLVILQMILLNERFVIQYIFIILAIALIGLGALQKQRKIVVESQKHSAPVQKPKSQHHKHRRKK